MTESRPFYSELSHLLVEDMMNDSFARQNYFGKIIHQFGLDQIESWERVLRNKYIGARPRFRGRRQ